MSAAIDVRAISLSYPIGLLGKPRVIVSDVSFEVQEGEVYGFLGLNGAGKSTTIKAILGLNPVDEGAIQLFGLPSQEPHSRVSVGYAPENPTFSPKLTGLETLQFFGELRGQSKADAGQNAGRLLESVGIPDATDQAVGTYSKGMRQRLNLAGALISDPKLLVLDEPFDGLDPTGRARLKSIIQEERDRGRTVFFSTHILADVEELCDRVAILNQGTLAQSGTLHEVVTGRKVHSVTVVARNVDKETLTMLVTDPSSIDARGKEFIVHCPSQSSGETLARGIIEAGGELGALVPKTETLEEYFRRVYGDRE